MNFSASQWWTSFVLDAMLKSVLITFIGVLITFTSPIPFVIVSVCLSLFHFTCLFLAYTFLIAFELIRIEFGPRLKFWLTLLLANVLFGALINTFFAMGVSPAPVLELSPATTVLVVTNLIPIFVVAGCTRIVRRVKRSCASRAAVV